MYTYNDCFLIMIKPGFEGSRFSDIQGDYGGATKFGITQKTYDLDHQDRHIPLEFVANLIQEEASDIYFRKYWLSAGCDKILDINKDKLALVHFNMAIERGPVLAIDMLQIILGIPGFTGAFGPKTLALVTAGDEISLVYNYLDYMKKHFLEEIQKPNQKQFAHAWFTRLNLLAKEINSSWHYDYITGIGG